MRQVKTIQPAQSIAQGRLICAETWAEDGTRLGVFLVFGLPLMAILLLFPYNPSQLSTANERIAVYGLLAPLAVCLSYVLYRAFTEKRLWQVRTPYSQAANQVLVLQFLKRHSGYAVRRASRAIIVALEYQDGDKRYGKTYVFLPADQTIHFCVLTSRPRLNMPALVAPWLLRADLVRAVRTRLIETKQPPQPTGAD